MGRPTAVRPQFNYDALMILPGKMLVEELRMDSKDLKVEDLPGDWEIVQPKLDGWYSIFRCYDRKCEIISRTGEIKKTWTANFPDCILIGEWMYGTNYAVTRFAGRSVIYMYDLIAWNGLDYRQEKLSDRARALNVKLNSIKEFGWECGFEFFEVPSFSFTEWLKVWHDYVEVMGDEGLVFKKDVAGSNPSLKVGRIKKQFTMDYVCMGIGEGGGEFSGMAGNINGGLYKDGQLVSICSIGGGMGYDQRREFWLNRDKYIGKVFEAYGMGKFTSGALRHPQFKTWRGDKQPEDCKFIREA